MLHVPPTSLHMNREESSSLPEAYFRRPKSWRTLPLCSPFDFGSFRLYTRWREAWLSPACTPLAAILAGIGF